MPNSWLQVSLLSLFEVAQKVFTEKLFVLDCLAPEDLLHCVLPHIRKYFFTQMSARSPYLWPTVLLEYFLEAFPLERLGIEPAVQNRVNHSFWSMCFGREGWPYCFLDTSFSPRWATSINHLPDQTFHYFGEMPGHVTIVGSSSSKLHWVREWLMV